MKLSLPILFYYLLEENHLPEVFNLRTLDLKLTREVKFQLTKHGKLQFQIFMLSEIALRDKCLLIKLRKKVSLLLNKFLEKVDT